jgi:hypothetical protein
MTSHKKFGLGGIISMPMDGNFNTTVINQKSAAVAIATGATTSLSAGAVPAINMQNYQGGNLAFLVNSGAGTISIATLVSDTATGTFVQAHVMESDNSTMQGVAAIVTQSATNAAYSIGGIRANFLKLVPTLTSTLNYTLTFTPTRL